VSYNPYSGYDDITVERNFLQQDLVAASQKLIRGRDSIESDMTFFTWFLPSERMTVTPGHHSVSGTNKMISSDFILTSYS
jgi:hypothetical protein